MIDDLRSWQRNRCKKDSSSVAPTAAILTSVELTAEDASGTHFHSCACDSILIPSQKSFAANRSGSTHILDNGKYSLDFKKHPTNLKLKQQ